MKTSVLVAASAGTVLTGLLGKDRRPSGVTVSIAD